MTLWYIFFTAVVVGLSGAMMPGPLLTVTITETARRGFIAGPLLILGHAILEGALLIALGLGLGSFLIEPAVSISIAMIGGLFLAWMGFQMAKDSYHERVKLKDFEDIEPTSQSNSMHPILAGILVSLSNPYWTLWWATIGLGYITMSLKYGLAGIISFFIGHILADLGWYSMVSAGVVSGKRFLTQGVYRIIIIICGVFLLFLGVSFIYYGLTSTLSLNH